MPGLNPFVTLLLLLDLDGVVGRLAWRCARCGDVSDKSTPRKVVDKRENFVELREAFHHSVRVIIAMDYEALRVVLISLRKTL
jgi:hypothetical protein